MKEGERGFRLLTKCGVQGDHPPAGAWGRLPVAQSSRWALAAPAARFAPRLQVALAPSGPSAHRAHASFRRPKALCRSIFRERCERPKARREACALCALATGGGKATRSAPKGSVSPVGCCAQRKATRRCEQIQGPRAASAQNADICEGSETMSAPEGSVSPVGCCAQRKATRRCEQIQGLRAASAQNADICERQGSAND